MSIGVGFLFGILQIVIFKPEWPLKGVWVVRMNC